MKNKLFAMLLAAMLAMGAAACNGGGTDTEAPADDPAAEEPADTTS